MSLPERAQDELQLAAAARRELGPDYESAVIAGFLDNVDKAIAERVDAEVTERLGRAGRIGWPLQSFALAAVSIVAGIPVTEAAAAHGVLGIAAAWTGIAVVNIAHTSSLIISRFVGLAERFRRRDR